MTDATADGAEGALEARRLQVFPVAIGRYADRRFEPLETGSEAAKVVELLAEFGGYEVPWATPLEQRGGDAVTERLRVWSTPEEEHDTVLYWVGHGWSNRLDATLAHHLSPFEVGDDGLMPRQLASKISAREGHPAGRETWAIVVVDACASARFVEAVVSEIYADPHGARRVLLVGVSGEGSTRLGIFSTALARCLRNTFRGNARIPLWDLAGELGRLLDGGTVQVVTANNLANAALTRRLAVAAGFTATLDVLVEIEAVLDSLTEDERRHFVPKAQGGETGEVMSYFSGRERELEAIVGWLRTQRTGMLVVTGNAGTGKSAILGHLLVQSRPQLREVLFRRGMIDLLPSSRRPADDVFDVALLLTGATTAGVVRRLAAAVGLGEPPAQATGEQVAWLLELLHGRDRPLTMLLDALDEAQHPRTLADQLIRRLSTVDGVRVVVGTRESTRESTQDSSWESTWEEPDVPPAATRDLLDALTAKAGPLRVLVVEQDPQAVIRYVRQRLYAAAAQRLLVAADTVIDSVAEAVAAGGREFLFARLAAHEILARPGLLAPDREAELADLLSGDHGKLFAATVARLRGGSPVHGTLLEALALAQGRGLPIRDGVWGTVAAALAGVAVAADGEGAIPDGKVVIPDGKGIAAAGRAVAPVGDHEIDGLLRAAAPYLMLDTEDGQTVYRLAHRTFQENFPAAVDQARIPPWQRHRAIARALLESVPRGYAGPLNPYLVRHLSGHVAAGGMDAWHDLASHPEVLDRLDPHVATGDALRSAFGLPDLPAEIAGTIAARHLLINAGPAQRRGLREIAMARHAGISRFPPDAATEPGAAAWALRWASVRRTPPHVTLTGHTGQVLALAALTADDGRTLLASGGQDGSVRVWNLATGARVGDRLGTPRMSPVWSLAGTGPGRTLLAGGADDGTVRLWNPATGIQAAGVPASLGGHTGAVLALSPADSGGRPLFASGDEAGTIRIWNPDTGTLLRILTGHTGPIHALTPTSTPDNPHLLASTGDDGTIRIWNPDTGECSTVLRGGSGRLGAVAGLTTTAGRTLLASGGADGAIRLWDPAAGGPAGQPLTGHTGGVRVLVAAATPDRRVLLASGGRDGTVRVWDPATVLAPAAPPGHTGPVRAVAALVGAGGQAVLATGGQDGTIRLWNPSTGVRAGVLAGHTGGLRAVAALAGSARPAAPMGSTRSAAPAGSVGAAVLASGGEDGTIRIWDTRAGICTAVLGGRTNHSGRVLSVAAYRGLDGRAMLASGGEDGTIRIWDPAATGAGTTAGPGGTTAASTTALGTTALGTTALGAAARVLAGHTGRVLAITVITAPDGRTLLASGGDDGTIRIWDPERDSRAVRTLAGHPGPVWTVTVLDRGDEPPLLASGAGDGTIRLWDPATGRPDGEPLTGHTGRVRALAALRLRDGRTRLASGSDDGTVRVWDLATRSTTHLISAQSRIAGLVAVGETLIAGAGDGVLAFSLNPAGDPDAA